MTALFWWLAALGVAVLVIWAARREHNERKAMRAAVAEPETTVDEHADEMTAALGYDLDSCPTCDRDPADLDALADHIAGIVRDVVATCEADAEDARNAMQYAIHPVGRERFHAEVESFLKEQS